MIMDELRRAAAEVEAARRKFGEVTDPRLVDAAALELTAAETRLRAVLMYARANGGDRRCTR